MTSMYQAAKWESCISFIDQLLLSNVYRLRDENTGRILPFKIHASRLKRIHPETPLLRDESNKAQTTAAGAIKTATEHSAQPQTATANNGSADRPTPPTQYNHVNYRNTMLRTTKDNGMQLSVFSPDDASEQADLMNTKYFGPTALTPGNKPKILRKWHWKTIIPLAVSDVNELHLAYSCVYAKCTTHNMRTAANNNTARYRGTTSSSIICVNKSHE